MTTTRDHLDRIVADLIAQIEAGVSGWKMPWRSLRMQHNLSSGKPYRGVNQLILGMSGRAVPVWATYKQWSERGAQVRKGEKGTHVFLWKPTDWEKRNADGTTEQKHGLLARTFTVFNGEQVDGWEMPPIVPFNESARDEWAEMFFAAVPATIDSGPGFNPSYVPALDRVRMPEFEQFMSGGHYYATLAHELTHWTGHDSRLARDLSGRFGSESYAVEELVAEIGSAFLAAHLELPDVDRSDHAAYLASWMRVLKAEPSVLWTVTSLAQAAFDHLCEYAHSGIVPGQDADEGGTLDATGKAHGFVVSQKRS